MGRLLVLGSARHRVLPHLPPALPHLGAPEALRLRDARGRARLHRRERGRADGPGTRGLRGARSAVRPRRRPRCHLLRRDHRRPAGALPGALHHLHGRAQGRHPVVVRVAGRTGRDARDGHRRRHLPDLPVERLDAADRDERGLRADRARLVLPPGADRPRRRGGQRAAL